MIAVALGAAVGLVMALTGAGGGILAVPLLMLGAGLPLAQAAPAGLLAVGLAAALGAALGLKGGVVRYKAVLLTWPACWSGGHWRAAWQGRACRSVLPA